MRIVPILLCCCALLLPACVGGSSEGTLTPEPGESQTIAAQDKVEIPMGTPSAKVLRLLGPASSTEAGSNGREIWRYTHKRAEYAYVSNSGNVHTLILGKYIADPTQDSPGQSLMLTIVLDPAKKVADFNFAQLAY